MVMSPDIRLKSDAPGRGVFCFDPPTASGRRALSIQTSGSQGPKARLPFISNNKGDLLRVSQETQSFRMQHPPLCCEPSLWDSAMPACDTFQNFALPLKTTQLNAKL